MAFFGGSHPGWPLALRLGFVSLIVGGLLVGCGPADRSAGDRPGAGEEPARSEAALERPPQIDVGEYQVIVPEVAAGRYAYAWSSMGDKVAFRTARSVWLMSADGNDLKPALRLPASAAAAPGESPATGGGCSLSVAGWTDSDRAVLFVARGTQPNLPAWPHAGEEGTLVAQVSADGGPVRAVGWVPGALADEFFLNLSFDGRLLCLVASGAGGPHLWAMEIAGGRPRDLGPVPKQSHLVPSPDGYLLSYRQEIQGRGWRNFLLDLQTGNPGEVAWQDPHQLPLRWAPDWNRAAFVSAERPLPGEPDVGTHVSVIDRSGRELSNFNVPGQKVIGPPVWSFDDAKVAFLALNRSLWVAEVDRGQRRKVTDLKGPGPSALLGWTPDGRSILLRSGPVPGPVLLVDERKGTAKTLVSRGWVPYDYVREQLLAHNQGLIYVAVRDGSQQLHLHRRSGQDVALGDFPGRLEYLTLRGAYLAGLIVGDKGDRLLLRHLPGD